MPESLPRICTHPGCGKRTPCPDHKPKPYGTHRLTRQQRGYTNRWLKLRRWYLARHPVCESCGRLAKQVHHKRPHKGDPALIYDVANLESLCVPCHQDRTAEERRARR